MSFNFSDKTYESSVLIVDALNLAFRWKHKKATKFADEYISTVQSIANSYQAREIIITADWGSSAFRKSIYPEYKGNRNYEDQTEEEREYFKKFFEEYENTLTKFNDYGYTVLRYKKVEADDIAAYLVKERRKFFKNTNIWLVSSDKDWDLLIKPGVSRFSYVTRKETTWDNWHEHYQVKPEQYISLKCLQGDRGDNIPGISGIGPIRLPPLIG